MCGILARLAAKSAGNDAALWRELVNANTRRGPDAQAEVCVSADGEYALDLFAAVLHMKGAETTKQPVSDPTSGNVLLWNGEVYDCDDPVRYCLSCLRKYKKTLIVVHFAVISLDDSDTLRRISIAGPRYPKQY